MIRRIDGSRPAHDPCADLQADISALLDRELDDTRVRRVLIHVEICPRCHGFLKSLRTQLDLHRHVWQEIAEDAVGESVPDELLLDEAPMAHGVGEDDPFAGDLFADVDLEEPGEGAFLERMLGESRERLGEVFYQLGRAYVLLSVSSEFFSITAREPVPIPEYKLRGQALLAGVAGLDESAGQAADAATDVQEGWSEARLLLDGQLDSSARNLDKGQKLLEQSISIRPDSCSARVMLGQCFLYKHEHSRARVHFRWVLRRTRRDGGPVDPTTRVPLRAYALESLGNICLVDGQPEEALKHFRRVVESGAMDIHPSFSTSLLNVAFASLRAGDGAQAADALETYYCRFPERRKETAEMLALRPEVRTRVEEDPTIHARLAETCPLWFGADVQLRGGAKVSFQRVESMRPVQGRQRLERSLPPSTGGHA